MESVPTFDVFKSYLSLADTDVEDVNPRYIISVNNAYIKSLEHLMFYYKMHIISLAISTNPFFLHIKNIIEYK